MIERGIFMKKKYIAPVVLDLSPVGGDEEWTGTGSGEGDNWMTFEDWLDLGEGTTEEQYREWCIKNGYIIEP